MILPAADPITHKAQMYTLLRSGLLGNTTISYDSVEAWLESGAPPRYPFWGVRTQTTGGPCRLNCPTEEVAATVRAFHPHQVNISSMISCLGQVTWLGDISDSPGGLECSGVEYPPRVHDWRQLLRHPRRWCGTAARLLLRRHLTPSSFEDLLALFDRYPDHVVELSALESCHGTIPGRNAIIWEVRLY